MTRHDVAMHLRGDEICAEGHQLSQAKDGNDAADPLT